MSHGRGKSDCCVVPKKLPNKAAGASSRGGGGGGGKAARPREMPFAARMSRRSMRAYDVGTALDGIRQTARGRRDAKFTGLLHHIYAVERLRAAYYALKRDAAAGVDGQTWQSYGQALEANLLDLSDRLARGGYRPEPVKRAYIDKADGSKRPLGVPALEDKIVQRAIGRSPQRDLRAGLHRVQLRLQARQERAQRAGRRGGGCERETSELDPRCGHQQVLGSVSIMPLGS